MGIFFVAMSLKVHCYLRTLRRRWNLTQEEVAALLRKCDRNRVSDVERGLIPPNAEEILAYRMIFGASAKAMFPRFHAQVEDRLMRAAYRLHKRVQGAKSPKKRRKRELTEQMLARATRKPNQKSV
jgi:transcriptional regulator with XRE-family HTH domain